MGYIPGKHSSSSTRGDGVRRREFRVAWGVQKREPGGNCLMQRVTLPVEPNKQYNNPLIADDQRSMKLEQLHSLYGQSRLYDTGACKIVC